VRLPKDLVAASAAPMVLGILADGESYGYAILQRVRELSGGQIEWTDGLLYPLLHRLEEQAQVEASWETSDSGRKRKYYRITTAGRSALADHQRQWRAVIDALGETWGDVAQAVARGTRPREGMAT